MYIPSGIAGAVRSSRKKPGRNVRFTETSVHAPGGRAMAFATGSGSYFHPIARRERFVNFMSLTYFLALLLAGGLAGFGAGFMGIGGGVILTPVCLIVFPMLGVNGDSLVKVIFGTNMFLVTMFSFSAMIRHHRKKRIDWRTVFLMGPLAVVGSIAGSWGASLADPFVLKKAFALILIISSALIVTKGSTKPDGPVSEKPLLARGFLPMLGFIAGFLGSFLGVGGGIIMVPALILLFLLPVTVVAGTSSSIIIFIGIAATISYMFTGADAGIPLPGWSSGYVWWSAAIPLMLGGIPSASFGAWLNARTHARVLQRVFGAILLIMALRILLT